MKKTINIKIISEAVEELRLIINGKSHDTSGRTVLHGFYYR